MSLTLRLHRDLMAARGWLEKVFPQDVEIDRRQMVQGAGLLPKPAGVREEDAADCPVPGRWFTPQKAQNRTLLYLHGGAYVYGGVQTHQGLIGRLALACRARALGIDYRLAPEFPFPAALEDAVDTVRWLYENGVSPQSLVILGDSAGGGLTTATMVRLRELGVPQPAAGVLLCPWADLVAGEHNDPAVWYASGEAMDHPLISPVYADLTGLPPLLIHGATEDVDFPDAQKLARNAERDGVTAAFDVYEGCFHVWHVFGATLPQARKAIHEIGLFVQEKTS